ncbi:MAG: 50S ribosomal protein L22 [Chloroflexi bacterium]|nr:50S ribosomal protein L22 [Chloroflexota bacterium]
MRVAATAKYIRISPSKVRLVVNAIRGKRANEALATLRFMPQEAAREVGKVVKSAVANAENNYNLSAEDLYILGASANEGPMLKRFRPRAHGRTSPVLKRSSHITIVVGEKEE